MAEQNKNLQSTQVIAKIFGVSTRRVEQLKTEGIIKGEGKPTKYDLLPTIQSYIQYLSDKANGRAKKEKDSVNDSRKLDGEARIKIAKAEIEEMKLKELRSELHRAEDVEAIMTDHVVYLRSMLLGLPGKLAVDCAKLDKAPEVAERIKQEVYLMLETLADYEYDPEVFKQRVRDREGWNEQRDEDDE